MEPENNYKPWTEQEDKQLMRMMRKRISVKGMASVLKRTSRAVLKRHAELVKRNKERIKAKE